MSFSDLPVLEARERGAAEQHARVLNVIRDYTRAFFDKVLRGRRAPLLDGGEVGEFVEAVHRFEPAQRPGQRR